MDLTEYNGMSYEAASREGLRLVKQAAVTERWFDIVERLLVLRSIMKHNMPKEYINPVGDFQRGKGHAPKHAFE